jgi:Tol biopolymer transport system component
MTNPRGNLDEIQGVRERAMADKLTALGAATPVNHRLRLSLRSRLEESGPNSREVPGPVGRAISWRPRLLVAAVAICALALVAVALFPAGNIATARSVEVIRSTELLRLSGYEGLLHASPAGQGIAVVEKDEALWLLGAGRSFSPLFTPEQGGYARHPAVSPDGKRVAFSHSSWPGGVGISVVNIDGTGLVRLTAPGSEMVYDTQPSWSPDGKRIAFTRSEITGMRPVTSVDKVMIAGADPGAQVHEIAHGTSASFSPDGLSVVYARPVAGGGATGHETELIARRLDGSVSTSLGLGSEPAWSPASQFIAFAVNRVNERVLRSRSDGTPWLVVEEWSREIWAVNVVSQKLFRLTESTPTPAFDLAEWQREAEATGAPATGQVRAVVEGNHADMGPAWSADGKSLMFVRSELPQRMAIFSLTLKYR